LEVAFRKGLTESTRVKSLT